jgi:hypothetical protein
MHQERIVATSASFSVLRDGWPLAPVIWDDVMQVRAYKRDELTTDLICLDVVLRDWSTWCVHEELPGWDEFLEVAEVALPGMRRRRSWYPDVGKPAFTRNETVIFDRGETAV